jgi:hypothetical protein
MKETSFRPISFRLCQISLRRAAQMASKKENDDSQKVGKDAGKNYVPECARFTPKTEKCSEILLSRYGKLTLQTTVQLSIFMEEQLHLSIYTTTEAIPWVGCKWGH